MGRRKEQFAGIRVARNAYIKKMTRLYGRQGGRLVRAIRSTTSGDDKSFPDTDSITISFFEQAKEEYKELVRIHSRKIYRDSAIAHGMPKDLANLKSRQFAEHRAREAGNSMANSAFDRFLNLQKRLDSRLDRDVETSYSELRREVKKVFNPVRGSNVAINEATIAASQGAQDAAEDAGLDSRKDRWRTNPGLSATGPCPICKPLNKKTRRVWEKKFPNGPPAHPRCVCSIDFVNSRKLKAKARRQKKQGF